MFLAGLTGCQPPQLPNSYNPHLLFTHGPCKVWRFQDYGLSRYYTECASYVVVSGKPVFEFKP
jgi:hypothetical protein